MSKRVRKVARLRIISGDCIELMADRASESVDAVVTDPPYGIAFMGKAWDRYSALEFEGWCEQWAAECLRVLKPGGHLLAFGGTRIYHRLAAGIEDAGFEIRDTLTWMYGSGFPKSLNVSKAIDKAAGKEREVQITAPATPETEQWEGWGTALKPAYEPIVVARKPLCGTVAANVLAHGTGAINVDGCRIEATPEDVATQRARTGGVMGETVGRAIYGPGTRNPAGNEAGRWPANVLLDETAAAMLDAQTGEMRDGVAVNRNRTVGEHSGNRIYGERANGTTEDATFGGSGGASRFFYCAKSSSAERSIGLDGFAELEKRDPYGDGLQGPRPHTADDYEWQRKGARNPHPTVKPVDVMRWLVRLVTPPGGTVLDPFAGSGTTGIACHLEGFKFIGIEREPEYIKIAKSRIAWWVSNSESGSVTKSVLKGKKR